MAGTSADAADVADAAERAGTPDVRQQPTTAKFELSKDLTHAPNKEAISESTREPISAAIALDGLSVVARASSVPLSRADRGATTTTDRRQDINRSSCRGNRSPSISGRRRMRFRQARVPQR